MLGSGALFRCREEAQGGKRRVYTDGPLIHNRQMMNALSKEDVREVGDYQSKEELDLEETEEKESVVVVGPMVYRPSVGLFKVLGLPFRDGTCRMWVLSWQVKSHAGKDWLFYSDPDHPEVIGLMGYAQGRGHMVHSPEDLKNLRILGIRWRWFRLQCLPTNLKLLWIG